jgi:hypothetical protein
LGEHHEILIKELRRKSAQLDRSGRKQFSLFAPSTLCNKLSKNRSSLFFEPIYLDILNDDMVGFANISACEMLDHLFMTYGNITAVDLENNLEQMRCAWDPQQPVESLFKKIQQSASFSEAGGVIIGHPHQINVGYTKIFTTGNFMSSCRRWNEKTNIEKTWSQFKAHLSAAHHHHKQMQGESAATSGYLAANADVGQTEEQMADATIGVCPT